MKKSLYTIGVIVLLLVAGSHASKGQVSQKEGPVKNLKSWVIYPASKLIISPNPASRQAEISPYRVAAKEGFTLEVLDMKGRSLIRRPWQGEKLDVTGLAAGMYVVTLRNGKQTFTQKLVVTKE
jgi:hypothetical protein